MKIICIGQGKADALNEENHLCAAGDVESEW